MINPRKVYSADPGLIAVNSASFSDDTGRNLDNVVYSFLRSSSKDIYYYLNKNEYDFIITKRGEKPTAIQVCYSLSKENLDRELGGLYDALRFLGLKEGTIVTINQKDKLVMDGLTAHILPAAEFLSGAAGG